ncbi:BZ3500_MvSof-1268-A1-R1_Chr5-1g07644 [Microbotryum saponariae]|uniref:U1 small nuclear ribonucleoprotein C n=1 Tax=Microbotryum saponariae TaxID=289078 RepID=A0A2X0M8M9_9BASI|nr:BZ3500_MvSof-1268-A1-R1_Chr5-1g07644 [Microbotryum saponariae]SDA05515.1 BZ3501_MvSof-1269-A2-R1_Chr5-2g07468 [Microbotryum saponariae]
MVRVLTTPSVLPLHADYCDYCDVFLTHDSSSVRKAHNSGRNHLTNVRDYYACKYWALVADSMLSVANLRCGVSVLTALGSDKAQDMIDQIARKYEGGPGGVARVLPMAPGMMGNMNGPPQSYGAPPPPMRGPGGYQNQGPPQGYQGGYQGGPPPPQFSGPPPGFQPPPGMQPPPNFFPPTSGASASAAPTTFDAPPLPTPNGGGAPLVNGLNPERARMLGLL